MSTHDESTLAPPTLPAPTLPPPTHAELLQALRALESALAHPNALAVLTNDERQRVLMAAGRIARPTRKAQKILRKELGRQDRNDKKARDEALLDARPIRQLRAATVFPTPSPALLKMPDAALLAESLESIHPASTAPVEQQVGSARKCYVCKVEYRELHSFYDQLCHSCGELNFRKRDETADLHGRYALITGARVKIGYFAAIKLLRAGAFVVVTTRFPRDAARRYAKEVDFENWKDRLQVFGADFRNARGVEELCETLNQQLPRLDYIINNACQTVRRPPKFYQHMMADELRLADSLDAHEKQLVRASSQLAEEANGALSSAQLSQVALLAEDHESDADVFPEGALDQDLQQVDLRKRNSWRLSLSEVSLVELLEVQLVNAVAPFVLNARLRELMKRVPTFDKHIVNVSAMEGQFYRAFKTDKHPHTNMAKAALNMMTRTSAPDYLKDGIHMNSVDTGWITDEDVPTIAARKQAEHRFHPPLDVVDGAARIVDPIMAGMNTGKHVAGLFLKDYRAVAW